MQSVKNHNQLFGALLGASTLSLIGDALTLIAIPWIVLDMTGSTIATAGVLIAGQLPQIMLSLIGGAIIDRFGARAVSVTCDLVNFAAVGAIPLLFHVDLLSVSLLAALVFLAQVLDGPSQIAKAVMLSSLIDDVPEQRARWNGLRAMVDGFADFVGPAVAGVAIAVMGAVNVLIVDAASFLAAAFLTRFAGRKIKSDEDPAPRGGMRLILKNKALRALALIDMLANAVAVSLLSLVLPVICRADGSSAAVLGLWLSSFAAGTLAASASYAWLGDRLPAYLVLRGAALVQIAGVAGLFAAVPLGGWAVAVCLAIYGLGLGVGGALDASLLQMATPKPMRGMVFAAFTVLRYLAVPVALAGTGAALSLQSGVSIVFALYAASLAGMLIASLGAALRLLNDK